MQFAPRLRLSLCSLQRALPSSSASACSLSQQPVKPFSSDNEGLRDSKRRNESTQQHWMDRRFPGLREWLDAKNRRWWLKGITAWCRKYPALQGQETHLQTLIEQSYQQYYARHADKVSDERSQTHLQELAEIIRAHMGEQISPALRFLLQSTLYLSPNPYKTMSNRLKGLQQDYGRAFETELTYTEQFHRSGSRGIAFDRSSCIASGDSDCTLRVRR